MIVIVHSTVRFLKGRAKATALPFATTRGSRSSASIARRGSKVCVANILAQIARFLIHAQVYGLGFDYIEKYPEYIRAITVEDISRVAKKYLDSENYSLVVVGPIEEDGRIQD